MGTETPSRREKAHRGIKTGNSELNLQEQRWHGQPGTGGRQSTPSSSKTGKKGDRFIIH